MAENEKKSAEIETTDTVETKPEKTKTVMSDKPAKAKSEKKGKIKEWWKGFRSELKKIVWPSWKQVLKGTGVVLLIMIVCTIALGGLDWTFNTLMEKLISGISGLFA